MRDDKLIFSDAQALTATAASEYTIDTGIASSIVGDGTQVVLHVRTNTALDSSGEAATLQVALQDSPNDSDWTTRLLGPELAEASVDAVGDVILQAALPKGLARYLRLYYTVGTENFTSGKVDAWLQAEQYTAR